MNVISYFYLQVSKNKYNMNVISYLILWRFKMSKGKTIVGFIALSIAMFMGILDSTIINIALPDITDYFHSNLSDTSWISTIYVLALSIFTITA